MYTVEDNVAKISGNEGMGTGLKGLSLQGMSEISSQVILLFHISPGAVGNPSATSAWPLIL